MKLLVDLQGCQSASRHRGIGRYSLALAEAIVRNRGENRVVLLANGVFVEGLPALRAHFAGQIPDSDFVVFDAEFPVAEFDRANTVRARLAELARERLIADIAPDAVLLTSLFEGFLDDVVTSVGGVGEKPLTVVTLYDLIPYVSPDPNWPPEYGLYYDRKIESLKNADLLLSISNYARMEAAGAIPELAARVINMSSACDAKFFPEEVDSFHRADLLQSYGINGAFVMSSGILETRKNNELLLRAFAALPREVASVRQIVLVGSGEDKYVASLRSLALELGLPERQLIITGHVSDDDLVDLYRLCELFVFPSRHEGFGLPPLEAMSCGAAVIGSNATSVPEVIGRQDVLFDPASVKALHDLMLKVLTNKKIHAELKAYGLARCREFSWDKTANIALQAISEALANRSAFALPAAAVEHNGKPSLAMICPLPPEQTGIADYLADLLSDLGARYDVIVISDQAEVFPGPNGERFILQTVDWFEAHAGEFARIVYQVGNSPFHAHMIDLLARYPGVVVLHDFFLSSLKLWKEVTGYQADAFKRSLINSHGYRALAFLESQGEQATKYHWPCSFPVVCNALELIVHSQFNRTFVAQYYGKSFAEKVSVVRQHRALVDAADRHGARQRLGIAEGEFLVCAFGFMDPTKLNHLLIEAWGRSSLAVREGCRLVFVGGEAEPAYAQQIDETIAAVSGGHRIAITGFAPNSLFADYLAAADTAVQLRTQSRGETSRTVLDCMAYGVPLVINAHGSMCEYPDDVLIKLPDRFEVSELTEVLDNLYADTTLRQQLSVRSVAYIREMHDPAVTVQGYADVLERVVASRSCQAISRAVSRFWAGLPAQHLAERYETSRKMADLIVKPRRPVIYLDISDTARNDLKTGIQRVARSLLREMLLAPPEGYLVIPVYLVEENGHWRVRRANGYLSKQPGFIHVPLEDELVLPGKDDFLFAIDLFSDGVAAAKKQGLYDYWRAAGARLGFTVFDLLPISHPQFFPPCVQPSHETWIESICSVADLLVTISKHVESELHRWLDRREIAPSDRPTIAVSYLGADIEASLPTCGLPHDAEQMIDLLAKRPTFLMVGTLEPRKGHLQVLHSFEELWGTGVDANLVIVGHEGWKAFPDEERRTIPEILGKIRKSPHLGKRLFWLDGISDEYLEKVYAVSSCLIAASEDEGFGLPLIEGSRHGLPILARDIPVFREVGGDAVEYFQADDPDGLNRAIARWLELGKDEKSRDTNGIPWITWSESAKRLSALISKVAVPDQ